MHNFYILLSWVTDITLGELYPYGKLAGDAGIQMDESGINQVYYSDPSTLFFGLFSSNGSDQGSKFKTQIKQKFRLKFLW